MLALSSQYTLNNSSKLTVYSQSYIYDHIVISLINLNLKVAERLYDTSLAEITCVLYKLENTNIVLLHLWQIGTRTVKTAVMEMSL